jgi:uncharacterized protein YqjF (DUF2071 family)
MRLRGRSGTGRRRNEGEREGEARHRKLDCSVAGMTTLLELLATPSRQAAVENESEHRPWPLPSEPWVLAQTWDDLLFVHYRVPAETLRRSVPAELELDQHDGTAWLGVTPFVITGFRLRGTVPVPPLSTFPELNVRTYVTVDGKPGIWFLSLDASSRLAVEAARRTYKLPYFLARMSVERRGEDIAYSCRRETDPKRSFEAGYRPTGDTFNATPGSLEWFLTERYCLYAIDRGAINRAEIQHPRWPLQPAEAVLETNTMPPAAIRLDGEPLCHFSRRQDVLIWPLRPV